ncbi:putative undecaprenyl diphosphate synthase-domain-containing protein [Flammula alnicola]|nr:putative undecaprenyl diphosphate synthase-domain-containing protein [Flammula alnicola]
MDLLDEYGVRLNVVGKTELLPESVQKAVQKAENMTRHNNRAILDLCMPYASRDEMALAVESCVQDSVTKEREDSGCRLAVASLGSSPPLDILVRTSGVKRLSDFMLWQENTQLQFSSTYWPDFGLVDFIPIILDYQRMTAELLFIEMGSTSPLLFGPSSCPSIMVLNVVLGARTFNSTVLESRYRPENVLIVTYSGNVLRLFLVVEPEDEGTKWDDRI